MIPYVKRDHQGPFELLSGLFYKFKRTAPPGMASGGVGLAHALETIRMQRVAVYGADRHRDHFGSAEAQASGHAAREHARVRVRPDGGQAGRVRRRFRGSFMVRYLAIGN